MPGNLHSLLNFLSSSSFKTTVKPITVRDTPSNSVLPTDLASAFQSASWIWTSESVPPLAPLTDRAFRYTFITPVGKVATNAMILMTADDYFSLYVNGELHHIGNLSDNWSTSMLFNVLITSTSTLIAVRGYNLPPPGQPGVATTAGLLAAIKVTFTDGSSAISNSNSSWKSIHNIPSNWELPSLDDSQWDQASVIGPYGVDPWETNVNLPSSFAGDPAAASIASQSLKSTSLSLSASSSQSVSSSSSQIGKTSSSFTQLPLSSTFSSTTSFPLQNSATSTYSKSLTSLANASASNAGKSTSVSLKSEIGAIVAISVGAFVIVLVVLIFIARRKLGFSLARKDTAVRPFPGVEEEVDMSEEQTPARIVTLMMRRRSVHKSHLDGSNTSALGLHNEMNENHTSGNQNSHMETDPPEYYSIPSELRR